MNKLLFLILATFSSFVYSVDKIGVVGDTEGVIKSISENGKVNELSSGNAVFLKDTIVTGKNSFAILIFKNGSELALDSDTKLFLSEYSLTEEPNTLFEQAQGRVYSAVSKFFSSKSNSYRVKTKTAIIGVKGTEFTTISNNLKTDLIVHGGAVQFNNVLDGLTGGVIVNKGFSSSVSGSNKPSKPIIHSVVAKKSIKRKASDTQKDNNQGLGESPQDSDVSNDLKTGVSNQEPELEINVESNDNLDILNEVSSDTGADSIIDKTIDNVIENVAPIEKDNCPPGHYCFGTK